jgi:hypothetical protein
MCLVPPFPNELICIVTLPFYLFKTEETEGKEIHRDVAMVYSPPLPQARHPQLSHFFVCFDSLRQFTALAPSPQFKPEETQPNQPNLSPSHVLSLRKIP